MRKGTVERKTAETNISLEVEIDGTGKYQIDTGCGFLDHMLELFTKQAKFNLTIKCTGDTKVDFHHTVEDVGISLGQALKEAVSDCRGISRYGHTILPMDEVLMIAALDFSGRAALGFDVKFNSEKIGNFDSELVKEFMLAFSRNANLTLHFKLLSGENSHHISESMFKGMGRAMRMALAFDEKFYNEIPSTKGII